MSRDAGRKRAIQLLYDMTNVMSYMYQRVQNKDILTHELDLFYTHVTESHNREWRRGWDRCKLVNLCVSVTGHVYIIIRSESFQESDHVIQTQWRKWSYMEISRSTPSIRRPPSGIVGYKDS